MCPPLSEGSRSVLYGVNIPPTKHISLLTPYRFYGGGMVSASQATIPKEMLPHGDVDNVPARLQVGELVIPVKHVPIVKSFLLSKNIYLPNM